MKVVDLYDTDELKKFNFCKKLSNFYGGDGLVLASYFFLFEKKRICEGRGIPAIFL